MSAVAPPVPVKADKHVLYRNWEAETRAIDWRRVHAEGDRMQPIGGRR